MDLQLFRLLAVACPALLARLPPVWAFALVLVLIQRARLDLGTGLLTFQDRDLVRSLGDRLFQQRNALLLALTHLQHQL